jgi:hypothetical protein
MLKAANNRDDERLAMLMAAVGNDRLEGEVCPNCFELYSVPILREFQSPILTPGRIDGGDQRMIQNALSELRSAQSQSRLRNAKTGDKLINEYVCQRCHRRYIGELNLVASQAQTRVLSFFGYGANRMYEKDFYSFSVLDSSYSSFVTELWKDSVYSTFTEHSMTNDTEDVVTGKVLEQLQGRLNSIEEVLGWVPALLRNIAGRTGVLCGGDTHFLGASTLILLCRWTIAAILLNDL